MKSIIALLPEGFNLVIGESFTGSDNEKIFVFEHVKSKKKLYAKLCSPMDIQQGFIWEILTPEALKELNVEESVNSEYYSGTGKVIEESVAEDDEQKRIREETEKFLEEQKKKNSQVTINLVSKGNQGEDVEELRAENEDLKNKLSIIASRKFSEKRAKLGAPDSITTPEELMAWEANKGNIDPTSRGSSGTLTLSGQGNSGSDVEFTDQKEMIEFLQRRKASGTLEEKREAKAVLDELWRKMLSGKAGKARNEGFDDLEDEGTPLLTKFHEEWKRRKKERSNQ